MPGLGIGTAPGAPGTFAAPDAGPPIGGITVVGTPPPVQRTYETQRLSTLLGDGSSANPANYASPRGIDSVVRQTREEGAATWTTRAADHALERGQSVAYLVTDAGGDARRFEVEDAVEYGIRVVDLGTGTFSVDLNDIVPDNHGFALTLTVDGVAHGFVFSKAEFALGPVASDVLAIAHDGPLAAGEDIYIAGRPVWLYDDAYPAPVVTTDWQADAAGNGTFAALGASGATYTLTSDEAGDDVRAVISAVQGGTGTRTAISNVLSIAGDAALVVDTFDQADATDTTLDTYVGESGLGWTPNAQAPVLSSDNRLRMNAAVRTYAYRNDPVTADHRVHMTVGRIRTPPSGALLHGSPLG